MRAALPCPDTMRFAITVLGVIAALFPARAMAAGVAVGHVGEIVSLRSARVAVAVAPQRSTLWAQVSVSGASDGFAWILPLPPGARIDLASDAWLDALDSATSPVVLPPPGQAPVG